jgi:hypothetical protein
VCLRVGSNLFHRKFILLTYPHTCPHGWDRVGFDSVLCSQGFRRGFASWQHPRLRSVLRLAWLLLFLMVATLALNLPPTLRSRENEFTDGRVPLFFEKALRR